jgi:dienelactone hydrolase
LAKSKNTGSPVIATRADINAAIEALSPADERRLERAARYYINGLGRFVRGRTAEELLQEATTAMYIGANDAKAGRHWPKNEVPFVIFLGQTMKSIVSHWLEAAEREVLDSETVVETEGGETASLLSQTPDAAPLPERELITKEEVAKIVELFDNDSHAWIVLEGWKVGMKGPEIIEEYELSHQDFEKACKRIRYKVKA